MYFNAGFPILDFVYSKDSNPLLISTDFLKYPFWHLFQTGIKFQLQTN